MSRLKLTARLDVSSPTLTRLKGLTPRVERDDIHANPIGSKEPPSKRWPLRQSTDRDLRRQVGSGDDEAFFELVARDPSYLFTDEGKARLIVWHLQHRQVITGRATSDHGASSHFTRLAKALTRGTRAAPHDARTVYAVFEAARTAVSKAANTYTKANRNTTYQRLMRDHQISEGAALIVATARRRRSKASAAHDNEAEWIETAIDAEVAARLEVGPERVRQLKRDLEHDGTYYSDDDDA